MEGNFVIIHFWAWIRTRYEKLHPGHMVSRFLKISIFLKIQFFAIFWLLAYISTSGSITIKRALKKHAYCLMFRIFGWSRGLDTPKQHLKSSSAIISTLSPSSLLTITNHFRSLLIITNHYRSLLIITNDHRSLLIMIHHY